MGRAGLSRPLRCAHMVSDAGPGRVKGEDAPSQGVEEGGLTRRLLQCRASRRSWNYVPRKRCASRYGRAALY
jgi:hypothetical protein